MNQKCENCKACIASLVEGKRWMGWIEADDEIKLTIQDTGKDR